MPRHHTQHMPNMMPILFARDENIAYVMPRGTAQAMTSCAHCMARACWHASHPNYTWHARILLMDVTFAQAELYLSKITASHSSTLNMRIANQNMLKRILIAMRNENMAKSNENFRVGAEESIAPMYKW